MASQEAEEREYSVDQAAVPRVEKANAATEPGAADANTPEAAPAAVPSPEPDVDDVIARLDAETNGLPVDAIRDARRLGPKIVPRLIELLRQAADDLRNGKEVPGDAPFFALYLLAELRAKEAFPAIIEAANSSQKQDGELFGDAVTEDLPSIFAVLAVDAPDVLDRLIADPAADMYVRWAAANTYQHWVRDRFMTRDAAVGLLRQHLRAVIEDEDTDMGTPLVCCLTNLCAIEAREEIEEAFEDGLVDTVFIDQDFVEEQMARGEAGFQEELAYCRPSGISDMIEHLSKWAGFSEKEPYAEASMMKPSRIDLRDELRDDLNGDLSDDFDDELLAEELLEEEFLAEEREEDELYEDRPAFASGSATIRHSGRHVGRNDPCPCGSGKKYKKCCGANA